MSVALRDIREDDLEKIMNWRMDEEITRYMNTNPRLTLEGQREWLAGIRHNPDVRYWLIQVDGEGAGVINLTGLCREDGVLGWAYYVGVKRLRSIRTALSLERSMYDYALLELGKEAVVSDVFTLNDGVVRLHKMCGCEVTEERARAVCKEGVFYDVTYLRMTRERWAEIREGMRYEKIAFPAAVYRKEQNFE
ncbi:MAG: GNAT family N-acetyltransferase [Muribaculum sp.]|nr:GNAT family N-acetyltransferase [Muribaculum sp.]